MTRVRATNATDNVIPVLRARAPLTGNAPSVAALSRGARASAILTLQARALAQGDFRAAAAAVATELAAKLGCTRVSIGLYEQGRVIVRSISNTPDFNAKQAAVRSIAAAMEEAIDQRATVVFPVPDGAPPRVTRAHARLAEANSGSALCSVPIAAHDRLVGAIVFERAREFDPETQASAEDAATFIGPVLELRARADMRIGGRLFTFARGPRLLPAQLSRAKLAVAVLAVALGCAPLWPATFRVVAPAHVEGAIQRVVASPFEGFVREVRVRPGERVHAGAVLATLEDRDIGLERDKAAAEASQLDKQYREALANDDPAQIVVARAKVEQAEAQLALATEQLERTRLRAPFDGVLISGDLTQSVGAPVKRGEVLMTVAPENDFRLVIDVDEQDIEAIKLSQVGRVMFAATPGQPVDVEVTRIAPIAVAREGRNVFEIEAHPSAGAAASQAALALRPGLQGVAKIDIDSRRLFSIWTYRAGNWVRQMLWRIAG